MKDDYYITKDGHLRRKENTIYFENENTKRALPVERIESIHCHGSISLSSGAILYLGKKGIPVHFFDYYDWYKGTYWPRETLVSGDMVVKQATHYLDDDKRLELARRFVEGATGNILRNLNYYSRNNDGLGPYIDKIEDEKEKAGDADNIPRLMKVEGFIRDTYYSAMDEFVPEEYRMGSRVKQPPNNRMNTLVSFGNSKVYTTVLSEIYNTQLNPTISFLHEPFERRFSLSLDVAEIFKPILADRVIFKLVNKDMLGDNCFEGELGDMLLSDKGRKKFLKEWNDRLDRTIKHRGLDKHVSYRRLIRLELYKLYKHFLGKKDYDPLVMWW